MVRIPDVGRIELRVMDGAANPYLMQAGILAAGLDGILNQRDPGERLDINMYTDGHKLENVRRLPLNLLDAIRITDQNEVLRRSEERRVGKESVSTCRSRWSPYH